MSGVEGNIGFSSPWQWGRCENLTIQCAACNTLQIQTWIKMSRGAVGFRTGRMSAMQLLLSYGGYRAKILVHNMPYLSVMWVVSCLADSCSSSFIFQLSKIVYVYMYIYTHVRPCEKVIGIYFRHKFFIIYFLSFALVFIHDIYEVVNIKSVNFCWISIIGYTSVTFWKR